MCSRCMLLKSTISHPVRHYSYSARNYKLQINHPALPFVVNSDKEWRNLTETKINSKIVVASELGDLAWFSRGPVFNAQTIFILDCNKNFVFNWMDQHTFPMAKSIYLSSHPCHKFVLNRFPNAQMYLSHQFQTYKRRWAGDCDNVKIVNEEHIANKLREALDCK